jgi:hypothetical protein
MIGHNIFVGEGARMPQQRRKRMAKARGKKPKTARKPSGRSKASRSKGGLKLHGDKLAHAVREAAEKPSRRAPR